MEVVSTSNLVSSETAEITPYNFQHDYAMKGQIGSYAYIQIRSYS